MVRTLDGVARPGRWPRQRWGVVIALMVLTAVGACGKFRHSGPAPMKIPLIVRNHGFLDADVFALQTSSGPAIRLETVIGGTTANIQVPSTALQPGGFLALRVHAVGSSETWVSQTISVDEYTTAELDIYMDPNGNMRRSTLYARNTTAP